jgi:S1-C subfamily serine protease
MAGVVMSTSIATGEYGWVQIYGYNASVSNYASGGTAIVAGDFLIGVDSQIYAIHGTTMGNAPVHRRGILAIDGLASSVTTVSAKKGFVHCL